MDSSLFTLSTSGTLIVSWSGCMKTSMSNTNISKTIDLGGKTIDHSKIVNEPEVHLVPSPSRKSLTIRVEKKPRYVIVKFGVVLCSFCATLIIFSVCFLWMLKT